MAQEFRFVKGTATRTKNRWSMRAKVQVHALTASGMSGTEALTQVASEYGIDLSATPSYTKNAGSHLGRFRTDILKAIGNADSKHYQEAVEACEEFGVAIEPKDED